jgi:8-amino-7-oxononanoate synthase
MDENSLSFLESRIAQAEMNGQERGLKQREGVDFSSNDYLGFSEDIEFREQTLRFLAGYPMGATGSRLLRGNLELHEDVEAKLANFCGAESALLFPSGYQANIALLSALLGEDDHVFSDEFNHASIIDGVRLGRARKHVFKHNDLSSLQVALNQAKGKGSKFIVTESLFSMEGDFAPLKALADLAHEYDGHLIVDESHSTGVYGDFARNLGGGRVQECGLRQSVLATIHTGGKALGSGGAWIAGPSRLRDYLINFSRPFIFSTAPAPSVAASLSFAVDHWKSVGAHRAREIRTIAKDFAEKLNCYAPKSASLILPIIVGSNQGTIRIARRLQDAGFDVRAIRPPTVPEGTARIRLTLKWGISQELRDQLTDVLGHAPERQEIST